MSHNVETVLEGQRSGGVANVKYLIGRTYESNGVPGMVYGIQEDLTSSKIDKAE